MKKVAETADWIGLMTRMVNIAVDSEVEALRRVATWGALSEVLEVGTGCGAHLKQLRERFPHKRYFGIEKDLALHREAVALLASDISVGNKVELHHGDFYAWTTPVQGIFLRLFVQHQTDLDRLVEKLLDITGRDHVVIIVDMDDSLQETWPEVPLLKEFYRDLSKWQLASGGNRNAVPACCIKLIEKKFRLVEKRNLIIDIDTAERKKIFLEIMNLSAKIATQIFDFQFDRAGLSRGLEEWIEFQLSRARLGQTLTILVRD